ncbi:glycosyl transferase family 2 [Candidatus Saccharibacteria bacterium QS_5_54_17]|nr:MAG: glycosyl transferase family 2 [Candidatus Saccharibacteria bacterium QS_5_54_17]
MRGKFITLISKAISFFPPLRSLGAAVLTLLVKVRGGKTLGLYKEFRQREVQLQRVHEYRQWFMSHYPPYEELERQKDFAKDFGFQPKISILVPTYNTDIAHLRLCIESVLAQTYFSWELCIADDASSDPLVAETVNEYAARDDRIRLTVREQNGHICAASNTALDMAGGDYVSLLDHDDILWPNALYEVVSLLNEHPDAELIYTDEDKLEADGETHSEPFFKPDWNPDYLRTINYITHFATLKKELMDAIGGFRLGTEGAQDWDVFLRGTEATPHIHHIPKIVYSWRKSPASTAMTADAKGYAYQNQKKVMEDDIERRGYTGEAQTTHYKGYWRVRYDLIDEPKISIIIPTKERLGFIQECLSSIISQTGYANYEIIIVDTGSEDRRVWDYYRSMQEEYGHISLYEWKEEFNFAAVCNFGAEKASGDYYLFLNNDTKVITDQWLEGLLEHAQRERTGAVGCKLLFSDNTIQHGGIVLGMSSEKSIQGVAGHIFSTWDDRSTDHVKALFADTVRNYSAVTAACLMVDKEKFHQVKGFNPKFQIAFNDVDLCLKLQNAGYFNVYTPHVKLYHFESKSVGKYKTKGRNSEQFEEETSAMGRKWTWKFINNDPSYNPNLSLAYPFGNIDPDTEVVGGKRKIPERRNS